jgi:queuine tRNA-ribosyltransferase
VHALPLPARPRRRVPGAHASLGRTGAAGADLRRQSAETLAALDLPGYAIGGLSVGEPKAEMHAMLEACVPYLPAGRPRHLLGVGSPEDFFQGVARGIDMFDCVLATRIARHGALLVPTGRLNIRNAQYERDPLPVEEGCACYTCQHFSRAYLRHLFQSEEQLGPRLATIHNLHFLLHLMQRIRESILTGTFITFKDEFLAGFKTIPEPVRWAEAARRHRRKDHRHETGPTAE